jgi:alpha-1,3-fucosyltransferase
VCVLQYFEEIGCDVTTCVVTTHRDLLASVVQYDAVLFQTTLDWSIFLSPPGKRSPLQYYVMSNLESPLHTQRNLRNDRSFFNLTMTYRMDSDIVWPYAVFEDQITGEVVAPNYSPQWRTADEDFFGEKYIFSTPKSTFQLLFFQDQDMLDATRRKTKMGAWFVSHCNPVSRRDDLVNAMQKYIQVDVYGDCGPLKCPRSADCGALLDADYKFYMSFENSLCEDYVTEKLFNTMKRLIIPVVYGGANYSKFVPPRSYIDANAFANAKELTDYLIYLDQHPEEYIKYFWWKRWYKIKDATPFCDLCKKLYELDYGSDDRQIYEDLDSWWRKGYCDQNPGIHF